MQKKSNQPTNIVQLKNAIEHWKYSYDYSGTSTYETPIIRKI